MWFNKAEYLKGFDSGFKLGLQMASEIDSRVSKEIRDKAISDTLERLNGNNKKTD